MTESLVHPTVSFSPAWRAESGVRVCVVTECPPSPPSVLRHYNTDTTSTHQPPGDMIVYIDQFKYVNRCSAIVYIVLNERIHIHLYPMLNNESCKENNSWKLGCNAHTTTHRGVVIITVEFDHLVQKKHTTLVKKTTL